MKVVGFAGYSGAGKTTLIEAVIALMAAGGARVGVIKHAHHRFDVDHEGKDSWRHRKAGAAEVLVASDIRIALMREFATPREPAVHALIAVTALASFTVSAWVNVKNNGTTASEIFALSSPSATDWGQMINFHIETGQKPAAVDTMIVHGLLGQYSTGQRSGQDNINSGDAIDAGNTYKIVKGAGKWTHVVFKYDGSASTIDIYANGVVVSNSKYRVRGTTGPLVFPTPSQVVIGGFPSIATGFASSPNQVWQALFNGSIDELRVYNKALSDTDVSYLYQLEAAGR